MFANKSNSFFHVNYYDCCFANGQKRYQINAMRDGRIHVKKKVTHTCTTTQTLD